MNRIDMIDNDKTKNTRENIIRSGLASMTQYGYLSSNLDGILKKINIPKGSFYYYFKSKECFGEIVIERYSKYFCEKLDNHLLNNSIHNYLDRIMSFYEDAKKGLIKYNFERGCLIGSIMQEESLLPESYAFLLNSIMEKWQEKTEFCLENAKKNKEIKTCVSCKELSAFFWVGWEGAITKVKIEKTTSPLDNFINIFMALIKNN